MELEQATPLINTVILLILFFYQKNKNKLLIEQINQQRQTINETKGLVEQQSTAIVSQGRVVDTAVKYSETFSIDKVEDIIRREIALEQQEERNSVEKELKEQVRKSDERVSSISSIAEKSLGLSQSLTDEYLSPFLHALVMQLLKQEKSVRDQVVQSIDSEPAQTMLASVLSRIEGSLGAEFTDNAIESISAEITIKG